MDTDGEMDRRSETFGSPSAPRRQKQPSGRGITFTGRPGALEGSGGGAAGLGAQGCACMCMYVCVCVCVCLCWKQEGKGVYEVGSEVLCSTGHSQAVTYSGSKKQ